MIKAVVFDVYGTLYDTNSVAEACERLYPGKGEAINRLWREKQLQYSWLRTIMGKYASFDRITSDALLFALKSMRLPCDRSALKSLRDEYLILKPFPEVKGMLRSLRPMKLGVLSNGSGSMLQALLADSGIDSMLDSILSADLVHSYKPSPDVYRLAVDALKTRKDGILFVSANTWDVVGAKSYGLVVGWVNRAGEAFDELGPRPDYEISSLRELSRDALC